MVVPSGMLRLLGVVKVVVSGGSVFEHCAVVTVVPAGTVGASVMRATVRTPMRTTMGTTVAAVVVGAVVMSTAVR